MINDNDITRMNKQLIHEQLFVEITLAKDRFTVISKWSFGYLEQTCAN